MGNRSIFQTNNNVDTIVLGTHTGNNATVASAAFDLQDSDDHSILINHAAWADTVAGGFVTYGLLHGDDTVVANAVDVPNELLTTIASASSTVTGAQATGVFARVSINDPAGVKRTTYLGNKRYLFLKRVSQTNVATGFAHCVSLVRGRLGIAPAGYRNNES